MWRFCRLLLVCLIVGLMSVSPVTPRACEVVSPEACGGDGVLTRGTGEICMPAGGTCYP